MIIKDYILKLQNISIADLSEVGAKNALIGEIFTHSKLHTIKVPEGFAITSSAFQHFIEYNKLDGVHQRLIDSLDFENLADLEEVGKKARDLILGARMPGDIEEAIINAYRELCPDRLNHVAVRSSAINSNLNQLYFQDLHDTFLNVNGEIELMDAVKKCFASLYSDKALLHQIISNENSISVCVQKMIQSDKSCSGITFTADPESGFEDVIHISAVYGVFDRIKSDILNSDGFIVYKPNISEGIKSIIKKKMGRKQHMLTFKEHSEIQQLETPEKLRNLFILLDEEILKLAKWGLILEEYYGTPISFEWVKDGLTDELYLLQARPENFKKSKI